MSIYIICWGDCIKQRHALIVVARVARRDCVARRLPPWPPRHLPLPNVAMSLTITHRGRCIARRRATKLLDSTLAAPNLLTALVAMGHHGLPHSPSARVLWCDRATY